MSFLKIFDGDVDLSNLYPDVDLSSNINDTLYATTPLNISGFTGMANSANGDYEADGQECNCIPSLTKKAATSNLLLSNSFNFLNLDSFYYFRSPSIISEDQSFDSLYAHPEFFSIKQDGNLFDDNSHYLNFKINSFDNSVTGDSIFGLIFDEGLAPKRFLNNLTSSFLALDYSFIFHSQGSEVIASAEQGFEIGLLAKQLDTFHIAPIGFTHTPQTVSPSSLPAIPFNDLNFEIIYGNSKSNFDYTGSIPYELGIYFKSPNDFTREASITNINLNLFNTKTKEFFLFKENDKTVISSEHCSTSNDASYIYSNDSIESEVHNFSSLNGSSSIFTNQSALSKILSEEFHATSSLMLHSDYDNLEDSLDSDPYGKTGAVFTKFQENQLNEYLGQMSEEVTLNIEGFIFKLNISENNIFDIKSFFQAFSDLVNLQHQLTGVYSEVYDLNNDFFFWRPKKGSEVVAFFEFQVNEQLIRVTIEPSIIDYSS